MTYNDHALALVLHRLPVHGVTEQLLVMFFELALGVLPHLAVQHYVGSQLCTLLEFQRPIYLDEYESVLQGLVQRAVVYHVALLVVKHRHGLHMLRVRRRHVHRAHP